MRKRKTLQSIGIDEFFVKPFRKKRKDAMKNGNIGETMYYNILKIFGKTKEKEQNFKVIQKTI